MIKASVSQSYLSPCIEIIDMASAEILRLYEGGDITISNNDERGPVTSADIVANNIIVEGLEKLIPGITVVSEERQNGSCYDEVFWLVDPLDGTKEFISGSVEFTVNIALIERGVPVLGIISAPALGLTYTGGRGLTAKKLKLGSKWTTITTCKTGAQGIIISSKSHQSEAEQVWIAENHQDAEVVRLGSSLKFCRIAEGNAHVYPRLGHTMEWDTAAGHAILVSAGGAVRTLNGDDLTYGKPDFKNPFFIAQQCCGAREKGGRHD